MLKFGDIEVVSLVGINITMYRENSRKERRYILPGHDVNCIVRCVATLAFFFIFILLKKKRHDLQVVDLNTHFYAMQITISQ